MNETFSRYVKKRLGLLQTATLSTRQATLSQNLLLQFRQSVMTMDIYDMMIIYDQICR